MNAVSFAGQLAIIAATAAARDAERAAEAERKAALTANSKVNAGKADEAARRRKEVLRVLEHGRLVRVTDIAQAADKLTADQARKAAEELVAMGLVDAFRETARVVYYKISQPQKRRAPQ